MESSDIDILIVGGGFTGLYLLHELQSTYKVLLVSSEDNQSLHMHGYLHHGYIFKDDPSVLSCVTALPQWQSKLKEANLITRTDSYTSFPTTAAAAFEALWQKYKLPFTKLTSTDIPEYLRDGSASQNNISVYKTPAEVFSNRLLYAKMFYPDICKYGHVTKIEVHENKVQLVEVTSGEKKTYYKPKFVVLATGVLTGAIIKNIVGIPAEVTQKELARIHSLRNIHMICIKVPSEFKLPDSFAALHAMLLMVTHPNEKDEKGNLFTLVYLTPVMPQLTTKEAVTSSLAPINNEAVKSAVKAFFGAMPSLKQHMDKMEWTVYAAWKQENPVQAGGQSEFVDQIAEIPNLCVALPSVMTPIPNVASKIKAKIKQHIGEGHAQQINDSKATSEVKLEYEKCKWMKWADFQQTYAIDV